MNIALLILTRGPPIQERYFMEKSTPNYNISTYVHYKEKNNNPYQIKKHVKTEWGKYSIVEATINLIQAAKHADWVFLMSGECVVNENKLIKLCDGLSKFHYLGEKTRNGINLIKSSQWWLMNNHDAQVILKTRKKYRHVFEKSNFAAVDEIYFLTVLMREIPNFAYTNKELTKTRRFKNLPHSHPYVFSSLTPYCMNLLRSSICMRKIPYNAKEITPKNILIITSGLETYKHSLDADVFLFDYGNSLTYSQATFNWKMKLPMHFLVKPLVQQFNNFFKQWKWVWFVPDYIHVNQQLLDIVDEAVKVTPGTRLKYGEPYPILKKSFFHNIKEQGELHKDVIMNIMRRKNTKEYNMYTKNVKKWKCRLRNKD
uniref:Core-2/I-Branching enzyme n=1 Tax=Megaviridae environmental sample TaxID=1737588 RepID=A0A5J6VJB7_9VIRU|nr:MAG: hypothetical protein [Megaviridae environmental sample]